MSSSYTFFVYKKPTPWYIDAPDTYTFFVYKKPLLGKGPYTEIINTSDTATHFLFIRTQPEYHENTTLLIKNRVCA